jgi:DNA-binding Lrp family transcriptional regulator
VTIEFEGNNQRDREIVRLAIENPNEITNRELGERYGISGERVRQIVKAAGQHKPRILGAVYECKKPKCKRRFRGVRDYSGHKAILCHLHRRKGRSSN